MICEMFGYNNRELTVNLFTMAGTTVIPEENSFVDCGAGMICVPYQDIPTPF